MGLHQPLYSAATTPCTHPVCTSLTCTAPSCAYPHFRFSILSFLLLGGPADQATEWASLDAATRSATHSAYAAAGMSIMVSAFGSTDAPTSAGADPVGTANSMAAWVKTYGLDGLDVDYEDFNAINAQDGKAEVRAKHTFPRLCVLTLSDFASRHGLSRSPKPFAQLFRLGNISSPMPPLHLGSRLNTPLVHTPK